MASVGEITSLQQRSMAAKTIMMKVDTSRPNGEHNSILSQVSEAVSTRLPRTSPLMRVAPPYLCLPIDLAQRMDDFLLKYSRQRIINGLHGERRIMDIQHAQSTLMARC